MFSIDQNSHSLWDALPKVQALAGHGHRVQHFIEDVDVAFTSMGAHLEQSPLRLERERFHRSGGADWGAALFYSEFLGRLSVEIRQWEPYTGQKTAVLARQLGRSIDDLYDEFSPGDNWQLVGPSYVGDREHHRTIEDLTTAEVEPFLRQILDKARDNCLEAFPAEASRRRTGEWFAAERTRLEHAMDGCPRLVDVYHKWMGGYLSDGGVDLRLTSELFDPRQDRQSLLEIFTADYETAAGLYNQAVETCDVGLRPLRVAEGELPFFAVYRYEGHLVRSVAHLEGRAVRVGRKTFALEGGRLPREAMAQAGIVGLIGKAILLVLQVRYGRDGRPLALPYRGSVYMPAAYVLEGLLRGRGLLTEPVQPIMRVRLNLLDRLRELDVPIGLPPHLRRYFGRSEILARELGENWRAISGQARKRLEQFKDESFRQRWQDEEFADLTAEVAELDHRRRDLARTDPKGAAIRQIWNDVKLRKLAMLDGLLRQIASDWQAQDLDYWDSRGAILPWCVALGGEDFYREVLRRARVYPEVPDV